MRPLLAKHQNATHKVRGTLELNNKKARNINIKP
jgi:hypothetical protein